MATLTPMMQTAPEPTSKKPSKPDSIHLKGIQSKVQFKLHLFLCAINDTKGGDAANAHTCKKISESSARIQKGCHIHAPYPYTTKIIDALSACLLFTFSSGLR